MIQKSGNTLKINKENTSTVYDCYESAHKAIFLHTSVTSWLTRVHIFFFFQLHEVSLFSTTFSSFYTRCAAWPTRNTPHLPTKKTEHIPCTSSGWYNVISTRDCGALNIHGPYQPPYIHTKVQLNYKFLNTAWKQVNLRLTKSQVHRNILLWLLPINQRYPPIIRTTVVNSNSFKLGFHRLDTIASRKPVQQ